MLATRENFPLLAELLAEQQRLDTPVARFAAAHDSSQFSTADAKLFSPQLIPLSTPSPGEQYAFEVDLDSCTGCKSCVTACHSLNGLDETETWRDVGLLVGGNAAKPFTQTVTTACHHCADPACLNGCPVLAYEKDPHTGIVRHLDDQCIGCSYCILKCPYDVPKFSSRLGIVRKCDLCHTRLAAGEAPACAQACPTHAIRIVTVPSSTRSRRSPAHVSSNRSEFIRSENSDSSFLPGAPAPDYTQPTTRYITRRAFPYNIAAADAVTLRPQSTHGPLAIMLTLLGAAIGLSTLAGLVHHFPAAVKPAADLFGRSPFLPFTSLTATALLIGAAGLAASVFHLGQPLRAWRIFLGWRTSWLSREAILMGTWFGMAAATILTPSFALVTAGIGLAALGCSAMIYVDTHRAFWSADETFPRFFGTALLIPLAGVAPSAAAVAVLLKLAWETRSFFGARISARLQRGPLARAVAVRDLLGVLAAILLIVFPGWTALGVLLAGEFAERALFFRAVDAPKMPGMPLA